jgi:hypothetical protein
MTQLIKIPDSCYIGYKHQADGEPQLGFMTPYDTTKEFDKRKKTVDTWVNGYYNRGNDLKTQKNKAPEILNNHPMKGFQLTLDIRRAYRNSGPDSWRILDPRGFELEVKSENLASIMATCTIDKGAIVEECIWGRKSGTNILLATNSDDYKQAVTTTKALDKSKISYISMKNVKIGQKVILENGVTGTYCGLMTEYTSYKEIKKPAHTFICVGETNNEYVYTRANVRAVEIVDPKEVSQAYLEDHIINHLSNGNRYLFHFSKIVSKTIDMIPEITPNNKGWWGICYHNGEYYQYKENNYYHKGYSLQQLNNSILLKDGLIYHDEDFYSLNVTGPINKVSIQVTIQTKAGNTFKFIQ